MTVLDHDYDLLSGMDTPSTVALSRASTNGVIAAVWTMSERRNSRWPMCFRRFRQPSAPALACAPAGSKGLKANSHKYLTIADLPGRNVAW